MAKKRNIPRKRSEPIGLHELIGLWAEKVSVEIADRQLEESARLIAAKLDEPPPLPYPHFVVEGRARLDQHAAYIWECVRSAHLNIGLGGDAPNATRYEQSRSDLHTLWDELAVLERVVSDVRMESAYKLLFLELNCPEQWQSFFDAMLGADVNFDALRRKLDYQVLPLRDRIARSSRELFDAMSALSKIALIGDRYAGELEIGPDQLDPDIDYPAQLFERIVNRQLINEAAGSSAGWPQGGMIEASEEDVKRIANAISEALLAGPRPLDIVGRISEAAEGWHPRLRSVEFRAAFDGEDNDKQRYLRAVDVALARSSTSVRSSGSAAGRISPSPKMYRAIATTANVIVNHPDQDFSEDTVRKALIKWRDVCSPEKSTSRKRPAFPKARKSRLKKS